MTPSSTLLVRRAVGVLFVGWAVLAIFFSLDAMRRPARDLCHPFTDARVGGVAVVMALAPSIQQSGIESGDRIVELNGKPYTEVIRRGLGWLRAGVPNHYVFEQRDGSLLSLDLLPEPAAWTAQPTTLLVQGLLIVGALIYIVIGAGVWWLKSERTDAFALLLFCSAMSAQLSLTIGTDFLTWGWPRLAFNAPLVGATTFHLFTSYPIEPDWVVRHRRIQWVPYGLAFCLGLISIFDIQLGIPAGSGITLSFWFTCLLFLCSLGILAAERRRHEGAVRDRADLVFLAATVSFVPILLIFAAEWILRTPFPYYIALIWAFIFPVAVGYGIVRRQLFEIRNVAKSSAAYGAASLAITGVFALLITFADALVSRLDISFRWFQVTFLFFAILAFNPLRIRLQALVDRFFDRDRETYRVAVREISEAMVSMLSLSEIADRILVALTDTMGVERAMVMMVDDEGKVLRAMASRGEWEDDALAVEIPSDHPIWKHLWMRREDLSRSDFDDEPDEESREICRDVYDTLEVELLVPILYGVDLLGVIAVGRKISGERLVADDRMLLRTLANQSSIAIENAKAFDEIAKLNETLEARVEERTEELRDTQTQLVQAEKMKSLGQLVAGVAHELNNPIGFVHANLQLLDEYIAKLLAPGRSEQETAKARDAIAKLLVRSREGTERVKKIVQDLRTFSRMDQAELQDANLNEEIERTLALMEPRFKTAITVERDFGTLPRVRCYPGQLNQVFLNLLMNACDAIGKKGKIRIRTRRSSDGVRLEFHDDGPGIPEEIQRQVFNPFFTTKPVGVGTGLGLSISHGIIERHGGRISVESSPGHGTTFLIELPLVASGPEA
ncbi:MAG TPA: ATP-binding protein [Myxococcota bacterium]|nr:ATP-binding protein [Myxococcota bacterium]